MIIETILAATGVNYINKNMEKCNGAASVSLCLSVCLTRKIVAYSLRLYIFKESIKICIKSTFNITWPSSCLKEEGASSI